MVLLEKLLEVYKEHGNIIVGVDFDDTVFPLTTDEDVVFRSRRVVKILKLIKEYSTLCLWTVADEQSLLYKIEIMAMYGIPVDYVNTSPITPANSQKPLFNVLLDDKAGLEEVLDVLIKFKDKVEK